MVHPECDTMRVPSLLGSELLVAASGGAAGPLGTSVEHDGRSEREERLPLPP